jgi:hypothetical protein
MKLKIVVIPALGKTSRRAFPSWKSTPTFFAASEAGYTSS